MFDDLHKHASEAAAFAGGLVTATVGAWIKLRASNRADHGEMRQSFDSLQRAWGDAMTRIDHMTGEVEQARQEYQSCMQHREEQAARIARLERDLGILQRVLEGVRK